MRQSIKMAGVILLLLILLLFTASLKLFHLFSALVCIIETTDPPLLSSVVFKIFVHGEKSTLLHVTHTYIFETIS